MDLDFANFDLDFGLEDVTREAVNELDIYAICFDSKKKERVMFDMHQGFRQLRYMLREFDPTKSYRFISGGKGFSSINFIDWVNSECGHIDELYCSTLRVGKKHIQHLAELNIGYAFFVFNGLFGEKKENSNYDYFDVFEEICSQKGWEYCETKNHSKIILMRSGERYFVLETSSNLNENPKIEQFLFEEDKGLFEWYLEFFGSLKKVAKNEHS